VKIEWVPFTYLEPHLVSQNLWAPGGMFRRKEKDGRAEEKTFTME